MNRPATPARSARAAFPVLVSLAFLFSSCATLRVPEILPPQGSAAGEISGMSNGIFVSVRPITALDEFERLFDEDLPRLGLAAVVLTVRNDGPEPVESRKLSFRLRRGNRSLAPLASGRILQRYYENKEVRMVSEVADTSAREALDRVLYRPLLLGPGGSISGLMFFGIEPVQGGRWTTGTQLVIKGLPKTAGGNRAISLALEDAGR